MKVGLAPHRQSLKMIFLGKGLYAGNTCNNIDNLNNIWMNTLYFVPLQKNK